MARTSKSVPYSEKLDKKADKKMMKGLTPDQKKRFEALDKKHRKVKTMAADKVIDRKIISRVKKGR